MQETNTAPSLNDSLTLKFQNHAKNTVSGRVLRSHVDHDSLVLTLRRRRDAVPVASTKVVHGAVGGVIGPREWIRIREFGGGH